MNLIPSIQMNNIVICSIKAFGRLEDSKENSKELTFLEKLNYVYRYLVLPNFLSLIGDDLNVSDDVNFNSDFKNAFLDIKENIEGEKLSSKNMAPDIFYCYSKDSKFIRRLSIKKIDNSDNFNVYFTFDRKNKSGRIEEINLEPIKVCL